MQQLRGIFPSRDQETFFETLKKALWEPDRKQLKKWLLKIRILLVDRYAYLAKISDMAAAARGDMLNLRASTNAASLALLADRANSIVSAAINNGALIFKGGIARVDPTKKSLKEALDPLFKADEDLYRDWGMWMVASRAGRVIRDGKLTPLNVAEIRTINEDIQRRNLLPMFEQVKVDYEQWNDSVVNFMKDTGIINEEMAGVFKKYSDYIPFYRNMGMDGEGNEGVSPEMFKQILKAEGVDLSLGANKRVSSLFPTLTGQRPPKKMKGGEEQLVDPLTGIMQNLRAAVIAGTKNVAAQRVLIDAVDAGMATRVEPDADGNVDEDVFTVRENGEEKYFKTDDDLLIDTLIGFSQGKVSVAPWFKVFTIPANILRETVTRSPIFMFRNQYRDSVNVWANSGVKMTPIIETLNKFQQDLRGEGDGSYSILENAGVVGGYDYVFEPKKFEKDFRNKMRKEGMSIKKGGADTVTAPFLKIWDKLGDVSQLSDASTRQVIYNDTLQNLLNKGVDRAEAESEAIFQAMETHNFSRRGSSAVIDYIMPAFPFVNARVQGLDVMYRSFRGRYKSNREGEVKTMRSFLARGSQIALASVVYTMMFHDDEEYKAASDASRDDNWIIFGMKFPTPFELGFIFKTIPERITRLFLKDDTMRDAHDSLIRGLVNAFEVPIAGPQAVAPVVEVVANHSFFTGRNVVPQHLIDRPAKEQYKYYTSEFSRTIGDTFGASPLKVEHLIKGYSGTMGSYLLGILDVASSMAKGKPVHMNWRANEIPIIGSLLQGSEASTGQMQDWNDFYFSVRGVGASLSAARSDPERQERIREEYGDVLAAKPQIERINTRVNKLRKQKKDAFLSRTIDDEQRSAIMDSLDEQIKQVLSGTKELRSKRPGPIPFFRDIN